MTSEGEKVIPHRTPNTPYAIPPVLDIVISMAESKTPLVKNLARRTANVIFSVGRWRTEGLAGSVNYRSINRWRETTHLATDISNALSPSPARR